MMDLEGSSHGQRISGRPCPRCQTFSECNAKYSAYLGEQLTRLYAVYAAGQCVVTADAIDLTPESQNARE